MVTLRKGPYGFYVQLGEAEGKGRARKKPKRAALPEAMEPATVDLQRALALLALPREVGPHPESGQTIKAGIGRFGPYLRHGAVYVPLKDDDVLSIGLNRAVAVIADAPGKARGRALGDHPDDGKPVTQRSGRYGPYVQHGALRATLPKDMDAEGVTLAQAVTLLAAKAAKRAKKGGKGNPTRRKGAQASE